jgi:DNA polymerase III epsilon subunit-like protein
VRDPRHAVGFDIETTGVSADDIITVACVWSPGAQAQAFHGEDFAAVERMLDEATLIHTYNGVEFDLPRLAKHCRRDLGPWLRKTVDPLYAMKHTMGIGACKKLDDLLVLNGFEPKSGSGLQAVEFWRDGERDKLAAYCMDDARLTYLLCEEDAVQWGRSWRVRLGQARVLEFAPAVL